METKIQNNGNISMKKRRRGISNYQKVDNDLRVKLLDMVLIFK